MGFKIRHKRPPVLFHAHLGPSEPVETSEAIRPLALSTASAWWTEGWFKIVVALAGLIIVAILVATFVVVGRNSARKEQVRPSQFSTFARPDLSITGSLNQQG